MARPESVKDIKDEDRFIRVGSMDLEKFLTMPKLLKFYTALAEEIERQGGTLKITYGTNVELQLPRNKSELESQLHTDQYRWDDTQKMYNRAVMRDDPNVDPPKEYQQDRIKEWAREEGLPDPYDVFATEKFSDEDITAIRREMGLE